MGPHKIIRRLLCVGSSASLRSMEAAIDLPGVEILKTTQPDEAVELASTHQPNVIASPVRPDDYDGLELLRRLRGACVPAVRLLICLPEDVEVALERIDRGEAYRHLVIPWLPLDFKLAVRQALERSLLLDEHQSLEVALQESDTYADSDLLSIVNELSHLIGEREVWLAAHGRRVAVVSIAIGKALSLPEAELRSITVAALLHDIGKITWPDDMLRRAESSMDSAQITIARKHAEVGARLLYGIPATKAASVAVQHHHERWDGSGTPAGAAHDAIPLAARIIAVADQFDRGAYPRSRPVPNLDAGAALVSKESRSGLDPELARTFLYDVASLPSLQADLDVAMLEEETIVARGHYLLSPHYYRYHRPKPIPARPAAPVRVMTPIARLKPGLRLARDVVTVDGLVLVAEGQPLDRRMITKLEGFALAGVIGTDVCVRH